jgi:hypothetical protein
MDAFEVLTLVIKAVQGGAGRGGNRLLWVRISLQGSLLLVLPRTKQANSTSFLIEDSSFLKNMVFFPLFYLGSYLKTRHQPMFTTGGSCILFCRQVKLITVLIMTLIH